MTKKNIFIESIAMGGYRSFNAIQRFDRFAQMNVIIGSNNSGKSNVLKFIQCVYPDFAATRPVKLEAADRHFPSRSPTVIGTRISLGLDEPAELKAFNDYLFPRISKESLRQEIFDLVHTIFKRKAQLDQAYSAWFDYSCEEGRALDVGNWPNAFEDI